MARNTNRIHDWRKLKWPFCVTFLYYALLCLYTGSAEASEAGFLAVLIIALLIDAVAYACYLFFLSKTEENMGKLWFAFILAYVLASSDKLAIVWQMLAANAGTHCISPICISDRRSRKRRPAGLRFLFIAAVTVRIAGGKGVFTRKVRRAVCGRRLSRDPRRRSCAGRAPARRARQRDFRAPPFPSPAD